MPKRIGLICLFIILMGLLVGCGTKNQTSAQEDERYDLILTEVEERLQELNQVSAGTDTVPDQDPAVETPLPSPTRAHEPGSISGDWVDSSAAGQHLGEVITVRVELSHCSYKPGINGAPTFCNDQPYPDHVFTYLVWGEDWSHFDQTCVLVSGEIVEYDGKAQIELNNQDQIHLCDDT